MQQGLKNYVFSLRVKSAAWFLELMHILKHGKILSAPNYPKNFSRIIFNITAKNSTENVQQLQL
jgi:hypothetical protein